MGYSRYRVSYLRGLGEAVYEMSMDTGRLWIRDLARNDRVISANGVEVRFPFLDTRLVELVFRKADPTLLSRFADEGKDKENSIMKMVLRQIASKKAGFGECSGFPKKAMQFGSGIAKISNKAKFGSNRQSKGNAQFKLD